MPLPTPARRPAPPWSPLNRPLACALLMVAAAVAPAGAADAPKPAVPKPAAAKPAAPKSATPAQVKANQAKGLALVTETVEQISAGQLDVAARVLTGDAECEFNQKVSVQPVENHPGHFHVGFKKATYRMTPQETTTGAVRLEDRKAGIVWLQIPAKSMLMNSKIGQRMVDACTHAEQRAAVAAVEAAGKSTAAGIGISTAPAAATPVSAAAPATPPADAAAAASAAAAPVPPASAASQ